MKKTKKDKRSCVRTGGIMKMEYLNENKKRIYISLDMGFLLMGILMIFISMYSPICGSVQNDVRATIGSICIFIWFIMFPAISDEMKDKIVSAIGIHTFVFIIILIIFWCEISYFLNNMKQGTWYYDVMFCVGGVLILSYLLYILVGFIKTFFQLLEKVKNFIFPKLQKEASGVMNVIQAITAGILSITAFGASIVGVITLVKQFLSLF